jgi:outer membrane protein assembly factor BamD (BamD/ComL family)
MKTFKVLLIFTFVLGSFAATYAQPNSPNVSFQSAQDAFDASEYEKTLRILEGIEKASGKTPRVESLRALTLKELNRHKEAYESLLVYFQLTAKLDLSKNEAHQSLIQIRDELKAQLEKALQNEKQKLQSERNNNAEKSISEKNDSSNQKSTKKSDPLEELELWNKVKESNTASDYYLFIERFPEGKFTSQARAKMNQVGDSEWNELKNSTDALKFREYIKKYPNSPFIEQAKVRYEILAKELVEWELIKESQNADDYLGYAGKFPNSAFYSEAMKKASNLDWSRIQFSSSLTDFSNFIRKYPTSEKKDEAQDRMYSLAWNQLGSNPTADQLQSYIRRYPSSPKVSEARQKMFAAAVLETRRFHKGGRGGASFYFGEGKITLGSNSVLYNEERVYSEYSSPKNNFILPCNAFDSISVGNNFNEERKYNSAVGKVELLLTYYTLDFYLKNKIIRQFILTEATRVYYFPEKGSTEREDFGPNLKEVRDAQAMAALVKSYCGK